MTAASPGDLLLCLLILSLALGTLADANPFRGVVIFIVFGLVMALSWTRLGAPDLALTEAALGAGVIGALFLVSLWRRGIKDVAVEEERFRLNAVTASGGLLLAILLVLMTAAGVFEAWHAPSPGLAADVYQSMPQTGVSNPVTAVILNYRVYDTFLEIGVLYLVMLSVFALQPYGASESHSPPGRSDRMLRSYARGVLPLMMLAAGYLLWAGAFRPGGAFQAGAVLGGAGILLLLSRPSMSCDLRGPLARLLVAAGFISFALLGTAALLVGLEFLQWPPHLAKYAILAIETASTLSIGLTLTALYAGVEGRLTPPAMSSSVEKEGA